MCCSLLLGPIVLLLLPLFPPASLFRLFFFFQLFRSMIPHNHLPLVVWARDQPNISERASQASYVGLKGEIGEEILRRFSTKSVGIVHTHSVLDKLREITSYVAHFSLETSHSASILSHPSISLDPETTNSSPPSPKDAKAPP
jgi:hypothetical protein